LEDPIVVVDVSASPKLSPAFLTVLSRLHPKAVIIHSRPPEMNFYDSVQDAADFTLQTALEEMNGSSHCLFLEDDIVFSSRFASRLARLPTLEQWGFLTFYLPGSGYGSAEIDPDRFYGTQCILLPREALEVLVRDRLRMNSEFPPGYDIRWSRFLASRGYKLFATEHSYVQHISRESRLHGQSTHASDCFIP
jgi:hypothetical protein